MTRSYLNVSIRVKKVSNFDLEYMLSKGLVEFACLVSSGSRSYESIFRYIGDDNPSSSLCFGDLIIKA